MRTGLPGFLIRFVVDAAALAVAAWLLPGIQVDDWQALLLAALVFGVVNALAKPVLKALTCPLIILTLGLFLFVINALMLLATSWIAEQLEIGFHVDGFGPALLGGIIIAVVSWVLSQVTR
jgi:putative membrane protein